MRFLFSFKDDSDSNVCTLSLEGISYLLRSNVIDIRTTIKVLSPNLTKDHRPDVIVKFTEILAIVAAFRLDGAEYVEFRKATLQGKELMKNSSYMSKVFKTSFLLFLRTFNQVVV